MATKEAAPERHLRLCEACGQVDDHPRHTRSTVPGDSVVLPADTVRRAIQEGLGDAGVAEAMDNSTTVMHMDCCASRGCQVCRAVIDSAPKGAKGSKLLGHIQSGKVDHLSSPSAAEVVKDQGREVQADGTIEVVDEGKARDALGTVGLALAHPREFGDEAPAAFGADGDAFEAADTTTQEG